MGNRRGQRQNLGLVLGGVLFFALFLAQSMLFLGNALREAALSSLFATVLWVFFMYLWTRWYRKNQNQ